MFSNLGWPTHIALTQAPVVSIVTFRSITAAVVLIAAHV